MPARCICEERRKLMKPDTLAGRLTSPLKRLRAPLPSSALREFVPQCDLTESLLCAYDKVAHLAYDKFLDCGARTGRELEDWLEAEQEVLGLMQVDVADSAGFVTALASLPGYRSAQIMVGIEPRWLLIFGCHEAGDCAGAPALTRSHDPLHGVPRMDAAALAVLCSHATRENFPADPPQHSADPARAATNLFCILELPAEVDPARCTAILSNGLLGIRMPKPAAEKLPAVKAPVAP
jgi:HSP20 family molecular chaperone IbpA